jgi:hypothetical protein
VFKQSRTQQRSTVIKFLPIAVVVFAGLIALAVYFSRVQKQEEVVLTGILHHGDPDFDWYSKYVELKDQKIQMGLNFAGNRVIMLSGILANGGERSLDVIELKVALFNYEEPVWETIRTPIQPGPYTPQIPPLSERAINFYIDKVPENWKSSHAEMSINGFRFGGTGQAQRVYGSLLIVDLLAP